MIDYIAAGAILLGSFFTMLSGYGLIKFRSFPARLHSASLCSSLAILLIMLGAGLWHGSFEAWFRSVLIILFVFLTTPIAAHVLARANRIRRQRALKQGNS